MQYLLCLLNDPNNNKTITFKYDNNNHKKLTSMPLNDPNISSTKLLQYQWIICFWMTLLLIKQGFILHGSRIILDYYL